MKKISSPYEDREVICFHHHLSFPHTHLTAENPTASVDTPAEDRGENDAVIAIQDKASMI